MTRHPAESSDRTTDRGTALVTGASAGIGRALARTFAADGWNLVVVARRETRLRELAADLADAHEIDVDVVAMDLAHPRGPSELYDELDERSRTIDALVNNVGIGVHGPFHETDLDRELDQLRLNVTVPVHLTKLYLPAMVRRDEGVVLNVASAAGFQPGPFMAGYYASKAYLLHFSEALAEELRGTGVSVTALCPGPIDTEFQERAGQSEPAGGSYTNTPGNVAAAGYRGAMAGDPVVIPSWRMKLTYVLSRIVPRPLVRRVARRVNVDR